MPRIAAPLLAAVTLTVGLSGCSFFGKPGDLEATTAPTPAVRQSDLKLDRSGLTDLLLTQAELPAGYAPIAADGAGSVTQLGTNVQQCGGNASPGPTADVAQAVFAKGMAGPFVAEAITAPGDAAARDMVDAVATAATKCANFSGRPAGMNAEVKVSLSQMTVPALGDKAAGTQLVATTDSMPLTISGQVVTFAHRGLAVTVMVMSMSEVDKTQVIEVAKAAEAKVKAAQ